jgi:ArsR family transcriptional regulator
MKLSESEFNCIAKALADPRRFQILEQIAAHRDTPCQELLASFPVTQPTMSHHLRELALAGLIEPRRNGQCVHYRYRKEMMAAYMGMLDERLASREQAVTRRTVAGERRRDLHGA